MKTFLHLTFLIALLNLFSCKETTSKTKVEIPNNQIKVNIQDSISKDSIVSQKKQVIKKQYKHYFVSAKSGLNYRDLPKGKVLGKFPLNTQLKVIEYPKITDQITDNNKVLKGEWLGIENEKDTVYVFSGFLSELYTYSELKLFYAIPYYKSKNESKDGFVNLSEMYPFDYEGGFSTIIPEQKLELGKDIVLFNQNQKIKILNKLNISNKDTLYIYNFHKDSIYKFKIANLTTIAHLNTYRKGGKNVKEYDYEIGLNLADKFKSENIGYAYIGKINPFKTGKIKTLIWKETDNLNFPLQNEKLNHNYTLNTYTYSLFDFDYFIQTRHFEIGKSNKVNIYHLVIVNKISNSIIFQKHYQQSEMTFLYPIQTSNKNNEYNNRVWTGEIFKNKPPIIFGLVGAQYRCPTIDFISETEPPIRISCDSRD